MCGKIHTHGPLCQSGESFSFCYDYGQECSLFKILVLCTVWQSVDRRGSPCRVIISCWLSLVKFWCY